MKYHKGRSESPARIKASVSQRDPLHGNGMWPCLTSTAQKKKKEEPELVERREEQRDMVPEIETEETDCKEPAGKSDREISVPMDELVEEGREETAGLTRQEYMNSLDIKEVSSYISHFLSEEILRCPALIEKWLKDCVNEEGQSV